MSPYRLLALALLCLPSCVPSDPAELSTAARAVVIDEGACGSTVDLGSALGTVATGTTVGGTSHYGGSCSYGSEYTPDVLHAWTAPGTGTFMFDTLRRDSDSDEFRTNYDGSLYVRKVASDGSCSQELACNDDFNGVQSRVLVDLTEGETVVVVVDGYDTRTGNFTLHIEPYVRPVCGDGVCASPDESVYTCGADCRVCGDFICAPPENLPGAEACICDCTAAHCGDGTIQTELTDPRCSWMFPVSEECDDGNRDNGDGCSSTCRLERCGDWSVQSGAPRFEECDDGNSVDGDGCNALCKREFCGDGIRQPRLGEECDGGAGCSPTCTLQFCGNGVKETQYGEECDDGRRIDGDGCNRLCKREYCGDGVVHPRLEEQCDDGNAVEGDGCAGCRLEGLGSALLFPYVINQQGYDFGIAISNTGEGLATTGGAGACMLLYFREDGGSLALKTAPIAKGRTVTMLLSSVAPGTVGYIVALCPFPAAEGFTILTDIGSRNVMSSYLAQKLEIKDRRGVDTLWFPISEIGPAEVSFVISNTSLDALGTRPQPMRCNVYREGSLVPDYVTPFNIDPGHQSSAVIQQEGGGSTLTQLRAECYPVDAAGEPIAGKAFVAALVHVANPIGRRETAYLAESDPAPKAGTGTWLFTSPSSGLESLFITAPHGTPGGACDFQSFLGTASSEAVHVPLGEDGVASYSPTEPRSYTTATCDFASAAGTAFVENNDTLSSYAAARVSEADTHVLLFPYATGSFGWDTEFAITNASTTDGHCALSFHGDAISWPPPPVSVSLEVGAGQTVRYRASQTPPGYFYFFFSNGYAIADCSFEAAHGVAFLHNGVWFPRTIETAYNALTRVPPTAKCKDLTVSTDPGQCVAAQVSVNDGSVDPDHPGQPMVVDQSPKGPYPIGVTAVTLTVTDADSLSASCQAAVTVADTTPPAFDPASLGARIVVGSCSPTALAQFPSPTASDLCGGVTVTCAPLAANHFGSHEVTCSATDEHGNATTIQLPVTVLEPLRVVFDAPLADDNLADDVDSDADVTSFYSPGSTVPHKVRLLDCSGADVTTTAPVSVKLEVRDGSGASVGGGAMALNPSEYQYNLKTMRTLEHAALRSLVTVSYREPAGAAAVVVGSEDARLESR